MLKLNSRVVAMAVGLAGFCGIDTAAMADAYERSARAAAPFSWTGLYVGVNGGYGWGDSQAVHIDETFSTAGGPSFLNASANFGSLAPVGGFGGVQVGANLQLGAVVLGVEVDGQWSDIKDKSLATLLLPDGFYTIGTENRVQGFGTFRPRLGLAWDRTLLYATGGLAWGRVEHTLAFNCCGGFTALDHQTNTQVGYVVGGGLEHAFSSRVSLKVEYQYINLGTEQYKARENVFGVASDFQVITSTQTDFHTVRLGLNFKLGDYREPVPFK